MKLLVLAQTPPPVHGQSVMVRELVAGLPGHGVALHHVNLRLSRDAGDIGCWRPGKIAAVLGAAGRAIAARFRHGCDTLYYVPAPAKRGALYRDWVLLALVRPFFGRLVLHWHAAGLGEWLETRAMAAERLLSRALLGRADLAIVLGEALRADAAVLAPRRVAVVRNGIPDPCPGFVRPPAPPAGTRPFEALYLGLCSEEKGLFDAIEGVTRALRAGLACRLTVAGAFADAGAQRRFEELRRASAGRIRYAGFVEGEAKHRLLAASDVLLFPTKYPPETQGLVVAEALAFDLPVVVTRWRAVPEGLPDGHVAKVDSGRPDQIAAALVKLAAAGTPNGALRRHFLAHGTCERHLAAVAAELRALSTQTAAAQHCPATAP